MRTLAGIIAGTALALALILIGETGIGAYVGEKASFENVRRDFLSPGPSKLPPLFSLIFTVLNVLGAFAGGYIATKIARRSERRALPAVIVGAVLIAWMLTASLTSSHVATAWLAGICATLYLPCAVVGYRLEKFVAGDQSPAA